MAITAVDLAFENSSRDGNGAHYIEIYKVTSDSQTETQPALQTASSGPTTIPVYRAAHGDDASAKVSNIVVSARQKDKDWYHWFVTVTYDDVTSNDLEIVPTDDVVKKQWGYRVGTWSPPNAPGDGAVIKNTAGGLFSPPVRVDRYFLTLRVVRNESIFTPAVAGDMVNSVNSASTTICSLTVGPREAKLAGFGAENATRNGTDYWIVTYDLEFMIRGTLSDVNSTAYQGHDHDILNIGYSQKVGGVRTPLQFDAGSHMTEITSLESNGTVSAVGTVRTIAFKMHKLRSFATLGLNI